MWAILLKLYLILLAGVSIIGIVRYQNIDTPAKYILAYLILTTISESIAQYFISASKSNLLLYHIYSPIQLLLISLFYNELIHFFKKNRIGIIIGISGIIFSIVNSAFLQNPFTTFNSNFLLFESIVIIAMTLCYFYDVLNTEHTNNKYTSPHFWIACILLLFWSFTFFIWLIGVAFPSENDTYVRWINNLMYFINIITYSGFGYVFLFYKKLQPD